MFRAVLIAFALLASPVLAFDDSDIIAFMDRDGPAITHGVPTWDDGENNSSQSPPVEEGAPPAEESGWTPPPESMIDPEGIIQYLDPRTGIYHYADATQEEKDQYLTEEDDGCPPERYGVCPELLPPDEQAAWYEANPDYNFGD